MCSLPLSVAQTNSFIKCSTKMTSNPLGKVYTRKVVIPKTIELQESATA